MTLTAELRYEGLDRRRVERASAALFAAGAIGVQEDWLPGEAPAPPQPWDTGPPAPEPARCVLIAWFEDPDRAAIEARMRKLVTPVRAQWREAPEEDWEARYRASFTAIQVSPRLVIAPPWDAPPGALVIEPGQGFGTGNHRTTLQALEAIERLAAEGHTLRTALDVGCGSGILALAAARAGLRVTGVDVEEAAIREANHSAERNGLKGTFTTTPVAELTEPADLVLANLHAELVELLGVHLVRLTGRWLVVAGILEDRDPRVAAVLDPHLTLAERHVQEGWVCRIYRRPT